MLGRALAMEWMSRIIFLEAAICVAGNLSAYVGKGYPRQCIQAGYWGSLIGDYSISTCPVCPERPHEEQANSAVEKQSTNAVIRTVAG